MSYRRKSLPEVVQYFEDRFSYPLPVQHLERLEEEVMDQHGALLEKGARPVKECFDGLYDDIPWDSPLRESFPQGFNDCYLENRRAMNIWMKLAFHGQRQELQAMGHAFETKLSNEVLKGIDAYRIESGPVKKLSTVGAEVQRVRSAGRSHRGLKAIRDIIRGRVIGETLKVVEDTMRSAGDMELTPAPVISSANTFVRLFGRNLVEQRPYLACNVTFALDRDMTYEAQFMTERAALVGKLTHPSRFDQLHFDKEREIRDFIDALAWGTHIVDLEEYHATRNAA